MNNINNDSFLKYVHVCVFECMYECFYMYTEYLYYVCIYAL